MKRHALVYVCPLTSNVDFPPLQLPNVYDIQLTSNQLLL